MAKKIKKSEVTKIAKERIEKSQNSNSTPFNLFDNDDVDIVSEDQLPNGAKEQTELPLPNPEDLPDSEYILEQFDLIMKVSKQPEMKEKYVIPLNLMHKELSSLKKKIYELWEKWEKEEASKKVPVANEIKNKMKTVEKKQKELSGFEFQYWQEMEKYFPDFSDRFMALFKKILHGMTIESEEREDNMRFLMYFMENLDKIKKTGDFKNIEERMGNEMYAEFVKDSVQVHEKIKKMEGSLGKELYDSYYKFCVARLKTKKTNSKNRKK